MHAVNRDGPSASEPFLKPFASAFLPSLCTFPHLLSSCVSQILKKMSQNRENVYIFTFFLICGERDWSLACILWNKASPEELLLVEPIPTPPPRHLTMMIMLLMMMMIPTCSNLHHTFPPFFAPLPTSLPPSPSPILFLLGVEWGKAAPRGGTIPNHAATIEEIKFDKVWLVDCHLSWLCCWTLWDHSGGTNLIKNTNAELCCHTQVWLYYMYSHLSSVVDMIQVWNWSVIDY